MYSSLTRKGRTFPSGKDLEERTKPLIRNKKKEKNDQK